MEDHSDAASRPGLSSLRDEAASASSPKASIPIARSPYPSADETLRAQMLLIRVTLGLNPIHDVLTAVRVLHDEGREAFEKLRGERCDFAHEWKP